MLILMRRRGEKLMIGDEVTIEVRGVKGNQVVIGIEAPKAIPIDRAEVVARRKAEGKKKK